METFSALLAIFAGNSAVTGQWRGHWRSQRPVTRLTNGWVNNRDIGDLRRHRAHYDVTVMLDGKISIESWTILFYSAYWLCSCMHVMMCWDHVSCMMTSSNGNIFRVTGLLCNSPRKGHEGQWRWALMSSLICAWTTGWVNNRDIGDLRRHHAYYDVTVIIQTFVGYIVFPQSLQWRPDEYDGVSNHRPHHCLLNGL